jgi:hypothetical protein
VIPSSIAKRISSAEPEPTPGTFELMVDGVDELAELLVR